MYHSKSSLGKYIARAAFNMFKHNVFVSNLLLLIKVNRWEVIYIICRKNIVIIILSK